jgi:hypothetical protein
MSTTKENAPGCIWIEHEDSEISMSKTREQKRSHIHTLFSKKETGHSMHLSSKCTHSPDPSRLFSNVHTIHYRMENSNLIFRKPYGGSPPEPLYIRLRSIAKLCTFACVADSHSPKEDFGKPGALHGASSLRDKFPGDRENASTRLRRPRELKISFSHWSLHKWWFMSTTPPLEWAVNVVWRNV